MSPLLLLLIACAPDDGDGGADTGAAADESGADTSSPFDPPAYSGGACPALADGAQDFVSGDDTRRVKIRLPAEPQGAPVLFAWHWLGGTSGEIIRYMDLEALADSEGVIVIAPDSRDEEAYEWAFLDNDPDTNPDAILFRDLLACAHATWGVDLNRVHATGMSAGGLWTTWLTMYQAEWLSSTAPLSGGTLPGSYASPDWALPVLLTWGGPTDVYQTLSFDDANQYFSSELQDDGSFVVECVHDGGHTIPDGATEYVWRFLADHPRDLMAEPYAGGLPDTFPEWCALP